MSDVLRERFPEIPWDAFFLLHDELPREGPGSDEATLEALRHVPDLPFDPVVYDVGCGPGRHTLVLAEKLGSPIFAVDIVPHFLDTLSRRAFDAGLFQLVHVHCMDMCELEAGPESIDVIWTEGSIYFVGFSQALKLWRPLLRPSGCVVASHATWMTENPPEEARALFAEELPDMTDVAGNVRLANEAGYEVLHHFPLPAEAWWDDYYTPLLQRIDMLRPRAESDPYLRQVIAEHEHEIEVFRRSEGSYTYVFYVMQKTGHP